nr:exodeoxyribonuclease VII large subunit [Caldalkalibacillus mannanilyticus]
MVVYDAHLDKGSYDVMLVVRGGGQESDFHVFEHVSVVEAIKESKTPVIMGIGHTDNQTLADAVTDRSETTPTKAASFY